MSSQRSDDPAIPVKGADGANQPSHVQHDHDEQRPESTAPVAEKQTGGFPAVGKAMAPLTQPVNYAIKGTTRALNSTVGVTVGVANGLVLGTTGVLGHAAEAVLPKDTGKPVKHLTDGLGETTTSATRGVHKTTEAATNGVTDTLTDTVTGVSNADILGITSGATGGLGRTVSGTGEALGDTVDGTVGGLGTTAGGIPGKGVSNLGKGTGNLVTGVTTGVGDGVEKLGKGDVLGSVAAIGGGLSRGVGGLVTGIAGYGRNDRSDNTFFGIDLGEKIERLKSGTEGEGKAQGRGEEKEEGAARTQARESSKKA